MKPAFLAIASATCLLHCGCNDTSFTELRDRFVLAESPLQDGQSPDVVAKVRKTLSAEDGPQQVKVVLKGKIYAGSESEPWEPGKAAFILTDFAGHDGKSEHDPHACPYCNKKIEDYLAFVTFGENGKAAEVDAQVLFEVKEKQNVTVTGKATVNERGDLLVDAAGIHIDRE